MNSININEILNKIKELPFNTETTIAELINYNPEENFVDPLEQGKIFNEINKFFREKNIYLEKNRDELGGLAFYYKFKKISLNDENINNEFKINNNISFEDEGAKKEYQKYLDEINEYNRKVASGEKPEKDLSAITDEFKQKFVVNHKLDNYEVKSYDENKKISQDNDAHFTCYSDSIGKIDFCKSYNDNIIKINNECLKELKNDKFKVKTEISVDLDELGENLDYVNENSKLFQNALEKLFEIKNDLLNETFSQTLFYVNDWWDNDKDEDGNIIDIEYIKKCMNNISININAYDYETYIKVHFGIEGLNGEDFLGSHILCALIVSKNNYKIEYNVE